jgi:hypothetical protein
MSLQRQLEREIESIENDDSLTNKEKAKEIAELERDAYRYAREQAEDAYNDTMERYGYEDR